MSSVTDKLLQVKQRIKECANDIHDDAESITLVAVSKGQSISKIIEAYEVGHRVFAENYLQEAASKMDYLQAKKLCPDIEWHFIGNIQTQKAHAIAQRFDWVHSVTKLKAAQALNDSRELHKLPPLNICLQIHLFREKDDTIHNFSDLIDLAKKIDDLPYLTLRGLMTIAPRRDQEKQKYVFETVFKFKQQLIENNFQIDTLSMGMSEDYPLAIKAGSTAVRIGTEIFGPRT